MSRYRVLNAHMFGRERTIGEHIDWNTPDEVGDDFFAWLGYDVADYAAANPHLIIEEVENSDHTYLVGFPVVVTVHADGAISLEICAEDIVEAIADDDNEESDLDQQVVDSATAGKAFDQNNIRSITVNTPKGA